jgi:hypothetical protein
VFHFTYSGWLRPSRELVENSRMLEGVEVLCGRLTDVTDRLQHTWPLPADYADGRSGAVQLALYLQECTNPTDRVLVTAMMPQVVGLADRGFAGGQIDLRAGFHDSVEEQQLTLERLKPQSVPVVIGPPRDELLGVPGLHWQDYGKAPRPGRKIGHCTVVAASAVERDRLVRKVLKRLPREGSG